jgi:hypothetical protein
MFHTPRAMRTRMAYTHTCSTVPRGIDADCSSMSSTTRPACVPMFQERGTPCFCQCSRSNALYFHMPANVPISHRCQERVDLLQSFQGSSYRMAKQSHGTKEWKTPSMSHGLDLYPLSFLCPRLAEGSASTKTLSFTCYQDYDDCCSSSSSWRMRERALIESSYTV